MEMKLNLDLIASVWLCWQGDLIEDCKGQIVEFVNYIQYVQMLIYNGD